MLISCCIIPLQPGIWVCYCLHQYADFPPQAGGVLLARHPQLPEASEAHTNDLMLIRVAD